MPVVPNLRAAAPPPEGYSKPRRSTLDLVELHQAVSSAVSLAVEPLHSEIRALRAEVTRAQEPKKVRTVTDICTEFGYSRATVLRTPWLMPNWGRSEFPGAIKKWTPETYAKWFAVTPDQRRREWDQKPIREKDAIQKGAKQ